ncbi:hypothetical protein Hanom_Chr07g00630001 [Helianthus anomalus]
MALPYFFCLSWAVWMRCMKPSPHRLRNSPGPSLRRALLDENKSSNWKGPQVVDGRTQRD